MLLSGVAPESVGLGVRALGVKPPGISSESEGIGSSKR